MIRETTERNAKEAQSRRPLLLRFLYVSWFYDREFDLARVRAPPGAWTSTSGGRNVTSDRHER